MSRFVAVYLLAATNILMDSQLKITELIFLSRLILK